MTRIALAAGGDIRSLSGSYDLFVGVDRGSVYLLEHDFPLDLAVGDFDSVTAVERERIAQVAGVFVQAPAEKDDTDLELALKEVFARYHKAQVTVFGAFGGRLDHMMSNLFLASEPDLAPYMRQIELVDELNIVRFYPAGRHRISPIEGMTYVSFMPADESRLSISHAKYPLNESHYFFKKCYSSNEFIGKEIEFTIDKGYVVLIYSRDRR
ncbi:MULTISPECIES: thiamine diphosphokinase [unclassified Streptococcus]|uniref:thiamine diphosphokinase n=1 Tax=unclassified Streptococcus TaxID=2608887 RepID=UPI001072E5BE|nr:MULTISPECIES: thiamine diphosphokinase [unclassified Streptococcus]MBF0787397.1 thiamine diphosphokinase [Streptococcus sp. 19428wC2_LYSM12]MCQ9211778.1 thiamine diphosphokinase [Streptococcus sp. B01]MCQ9213033.1 thiamine diphosphokinase [Streptococcus sp. O1]TFV05619.1 thiamine diphosphokinase [Streptococcus sp. LYSM12]